MKLVLFFCHALKFFLLYLKFNFCYPFLFYFQKSFLPSIPLKKIQLNSATPKTEKNAILWISHTSGGGTSLYEKNKFASFKDTDIFLLSQLTYRNYFLGYALENIFTGKKIKFPTSKFMQVVNSFSHIYVNSLVSYHHCPEIVNEISAYKNDNQDVQIEYFVHDFHCVCPRYNLIADGQYCKLECKKNQCGFSQKENIFAGDIFDWRKNWSVFFECVDKITCFSNSSKNILLKSYSEIPNLAEKIFIVPHDMTWCNFSRIPNLDKLPLHIGIVGCCINEAKGKNVINELLVKLDEQIPISIVGTPKNCLNDFSTTRENISFVEKYEHDDLQQILEKEQVSLAVFPSVCPETFSYVTSELLQMGLPVFCFDIGAQAEKVSASGNGKIFTNVEEMIKYINFIAINDKKI